MAKQTGIIPKKFYNKSEVARIFAVSIGTVDAWIDHGYLKAVRLPGRKGDDRQIVKITVESVKKMKEGIV